MPARLAGEGVSGMLDVEECEWAEMESADSEMVRESGEGVEYETGMDEGGGCTWGFGAGVMDMGMGLGIDVGVSMGRYSL